MATHAWDQFAELLEVVVPDGGAVVVIRYVYLDESSTHAGSPYLAMAGYVFDKEQAMRFSRDWKKDLDRFGLPFAHMTDCALGNDHYASLSLQERIDSEKALIAHTRHRSLFGVAFGVDNKRYSELFGDGRYDHDAYTFCLMLCVRAIHERAKELGYQGRFAYIFEAGHAAQAQANAVMNKIRVGEAGKSYSSHTFIDKRDAPPIQAADMLAWQYAHYLKRRADGHLKRRADFDALMRPRDKLQEFGADAIDQWRTLMDDFNGDIIQQVREAFPDAPDQAAAYAASQLKQRS